MLEKNRKDEAQRAPSPEISGPLLYYTEAVIDHFNNPRNIGVDDDAIEALGGIPENKKHCSLLGINALHAAIADSRKRPGNPRPRGMMQVPTESGQTRGARDSTARRMNTIGLVKTDES